MKRSQSSALFALLMVAAHSASAQSVISRRPDRDTTPTHSPDEMRAERTTMMRIIASIQSAQDAYFSSKKRYAETLEQLGTELLPRGISVALRTPSVTSWTVTVKSTKVPDIQCGAAAVNTENPLSKRLDGAISCVRG